MRRSLLFFSIVSALSIPGIAAAQVRSDRPIALEGGDANDRQVIDLHDAAQEGDALNARSLRNASYRYAEVSGTTQWTVVLQPALTQVSPGLCLLLRSTEGNSGPVTIDLGTAGTFQLRKGPGTLLAADDVLPGETVSVVFDGTAFQLIAARPEARRPCPPGSVAVNTQYCIEVAQHDTAEFDMASITCGQQNGRLCTWGEWWTACYMSETLGLQSMTGDWEWTNNAANADQYVRVVGQSSCTHSATSGGWGSLQRSFRCCYRR